MAALVALLAVGFAQPAAAHAGCFGAGWTWEPWVLILLGGAVGAYLIGMMRMDREQRRRILGRFRCAYFAGGIAALVVALVSPLDALAERLFSAHMTQHLLLLLVAPPLLVLGRPVIVWLWAFDAQERRTIGRTWMTLRDVVQRLTRPLPVWLALSFVLWLWHLPGPYTWALQNKAMHVAEHASFFLASLAFWNLVIAPYGRRALSHGAALLYVASMAVQNGLLGALLTFAAHSLYPVHAAVTAFYGLTPLEDQQLAGVIMWVPASAIHLWTLGALFVVWLETPERRALKTALPSAALRCVWVVPLLAVWLAGCTGKASPPAAQAQGTNPQRGAALIQTYGCGVCHAVPGVRNAVGMVGPPFAELAQRGYVAGMLRNTPDNLVTWLRSPQSIVPGNAMPDMGVSEQDARDIAAYLYTLR